MCTYPQMTQPNQLINAAKDPSVNVALKSLNVCAEKCGIWILNVENESAAASCFHFDVNFIYSFIQFWC